MKSEIILHDHSVTFEANEPVVEKDGLVVNIVGGIGPRGTKGDTPVKGVDYFTEEDIDEISDAAAGKVYVPTNVSELENDAGYLTEHQDISGKADRDEIPTRVSELENDMGYLTEHQDISGKADKSELPTRVSELENDAGYLTAHQDISQKADKSEIPVNVSELVNDAGYLTQHQDISSKAEKSEIPIKVSELENDTGYITGYTETDPTVPEWAKNSVKPSYTAAEVGALPDSTHIPNTTGELENDAGFITAEDLPVNVSELVNDAGYLTQHQDISGKADKSEIPVNVSQLTNDAGYLTEHQDITGKADKGEIPTKVSQLTNDSGYLTTETDPTVPAWAKAAQKPEYTAAEVGATTEQQVESMIADAVPEVPVQDVQVNGASILQNGVANIPVASYSNGQASLGLVKAYGLGIYVGEDGEISIKKASDRQIKTGSGESAPVVAAVSHQAAFYGLAKAAGDTTQSQSSNAVGAYTDEAKAAIQTMLDVPAKSDIPDVPVQDVQVDGVSVLNNGVASIEAATSSKAGVVIVNPSYGMYMTNRHIVIQPQNDSTIKKGTWSYGAITPEKQHLSTFYGLAKAAGHDEKDSVLSAGQYTDEAKAAIQTMLDVPSKSDIPDIPVQDVQVNGTSVVNNETANIPVANDATFGVIRTSQTYGTGIHDGQLQIQAAPASHYKSGGGNWRPVVPSHQHESTFYGLAKAAGDTSQSVSSNTVGTYTDEAKTAIQTMLDVPAKADIPEVPVQDVQINATSTLQNGVANIPVASANTLGVVKADADYGTEIANQRVKIVKAADDQVKQGTHTSRPITPSSQHMSAFYGLAKAAGDTTQSSSSNAVGTYTESAKSAIRSMLGAANADDIVAVQDTQPTSEDNKIWLPETPPAGVEVPTVAEMNAALAEKVDDVQVNGVSVVQNGVANIPMATEQQLGTVRPNPMYGIGIFSAGGLKLEPATDAHYKTGSVAGYRAVQVGDQHKAVFYGLAKAAGDTTQAQSDNPVGSYTDSAKTAIKTMLGIEEGGSSGEVVTPIDDTAGVGDTAKVWSADKTSAEINNIIDTAPTEELAADLLMQEETNTYLNEKFLSSIHNMFESLPQDEILSEILDGLVDGNGLLRQLYHELEARKLAAE